jgi:hypothetical protein
VIVLVLGVVAVMPGGTRAQPSFYAAAAQVIPVLLLALVVERLWRGWRSMARVPVVVLLVLGEVAAMLGTAYDVQTKGHTDYLVASSRLRTDLLEYFAVVGVGVGLIAVLWNTFFEPDAVVVGKESSGDSKQDDS